MSKVYELGRKMLAEARMNTPDAELFWIIGNDVRRDIFMASVMLREITPEESAAHQSRPKSRGDMEFCGLPAFLDYSLGARMRLMESRLISESTVVDEAVPMNGEK
jgi:hypothetical protein